MSSKKSTPLATWTESDGASGSGCIAPILLAVTAMPRASLDRYFLTTALFSEERAGYWRTCLEAAAEPERAAPAKERAEEIEAEIADLERRLTRQLVNLEADDVTAALRRRVGQRVAELEDAIAERRERLAALARDSATEAPTLADVAPLLDRLPILATSLDTAPRGELRAMFDALQLDVVYQPAENSVDVAVTLYDGGDHTAHAAAQVRAEDCSAPPAGAGPVLRRVVRLSRRLALDSRVKATDEPGQLW